MHPRMNIAGLTVSSYLVCLCLALLFSGSLFVILAPRFSVSRCRAAAMAALAISLGLFGSKAQSILFETGLSRWLSSPGPLLSGLGVQGGLVLGGLGLVLASRLVHLKVADVLDLASPAAALGLSIGRVGCLLAGCCYGRPTLFALALVYTDFDAAARPIGVPLHAAPVYLSLGCALLCLYLLLFRLSRRRFSGQMMCELVLFYGALRFAVEFLRADPRGPGVLGLSFPQLVCLAAMIPAAWIYARRTARTTAVRPGPSPTGPGI